MGSEPFLSSAVMGYVPILLIFGIIYLLIVRPQNLAEKEHKGLLEGLKKGDLVVTKGGVMGEIVRAEGVVVQLKVADGATLRVVRQAVSRLQDADEAKAWAAK